MKIRRFQQGGSLGASYATYTPMVLPDSTDGYSKSVTKTSGSSSKDDDDDEFAITKDDIKDLLKDVLPSDASVIMSEYQKVINKVNQLENMRDYASPGEERMYERMINNIITSGMLRIQGLKNKSSYDKSLMDKYDSNISNNGASNDYAVDSNGFLFYIGENGKLERCSFDEREGKQLLTYRDLQMYRSDAINGAFDTTAVSALSTSVSFKDIYTNINNIVSGIGEMTNERTVFGKKSSDYITKGLESIVQDGRNGIYSIDVTDTSSSAEQKRYALESVIDMLPANQLTALKIRAEMNGKTVEELVYKIIAMRDSPTYKMKATLDYDEEKENASKSSSGDLKPNLGYAYAITRGAGDVENLSLMTNGANNNYAYMTSIKKLPFTMMNDIKKQTLQGIQTDEDISKVADFGSMSINGVPIDSTMANKFALTNTNMYYMYMYSKNENGTIVPNFDRLNYMNKVNDVINSEFNGEVTSENYMSVNNRMREMNIPITFGADGNPTDSNIVRFIAFDVASDIDTMSDIEGLSENSYKVITDNAQAEYVRERTGQEESFNIFRANRVARAVVFMPSNKSYISMAINTNGVPKTPINENFVEHDMHLQTRANRPAYVNPE